MSSPLRMTASCDKPHERHHCCLQRSRHGRLDDARVGVEVGQAVEQTLDDAPRGDRVDEEAVIEREEHVRDVWHDEHLGLVETGL